MSISALDKSLIAVITNGSTWVQPHVDAMKMAGARVRVCAADASLWSILSALDYDAILLAAESENRWIARALREEPKLRKIPAIAILGSGAVDDEIGVAGVRPNDAGELLDEIEALLEAHATRSRPSLRPLSASSPELRALEAGFHDMKILLGVIVGYGANLRDGTDGALTETQRAHVLEIMEAASDTATLLEQAIAASRSASLRIPATQPAARMRSHLDVNNLVQTVARMFATGAEQRGIELAVTTTQPIWVWGNLMHLKQVIANLITNSLKYTPENGRIRVGTRTTNTGHAEIFVGDSGPGIPVADRERIFEMGVRLDREAPGTGSGIGLAVVRELVVVQHGGAVRVDESALGGTEIVVSLPLDQRRGRDPSPSGTDRIESKPDSSRKSGILS
jgi:signal transduction histidine kinase